MASKVSNLIDGVEQEVPAPVPVVKPAAEEEPVLPESDSEKTEDDGGIIVVIALKAPILRQMPNRKPSDAVPDCSSPSESGFIIKPSSKPPQSSNRKKKFTEEEEIIMLQGLAMFWENGRNNKWTEFHNYIKDRLPRQFTKIQISEKIRGLRRKFDNNVVRAYMRGHLDLTGHERVLLELSQQLWDNKIGIPIGKPKMIGGPAGEGTSGDGGNRESKKQKAKVVEEEMGKEEFESEFPLLTAAPFQLWDDEIGIPIGKRKMIGGAAGEGTSRDGENRESKKQKVKVEEEMGMEEFELEFPLVAASLVGFGSPEVVRKTYRWMGREKAQEMEEEWRELKDWKHALKMKTAEFAKAANPLISVKPVFFIFNK